MTFAGDTRRADRSGQYRALIERLPLVTYVVDYGKATIFMSPQIEPLLGYSVQEWLDDPEIFVRLLHRDERGRVLAEIAEANAAGGDL